MKTNTSHTNQPHTTWPKIPRSVHARFRLARILSGCIGATLLGLGNATKADDINWVGYQAGPAGGVAANPFGYASFFHGDQWLNYVVPGSNLVPGSSDRAIFDSTFDPQANGMPFDVYFGDVTVPVYAYNPAAFVVPGGDAVINELFVRNGGFHFHFADGTGFAQGSLTVKSGMAVGYTDGTNASLTLTSGRLTTGTSATSTAAVHIAGGGDTPGIGSKGVVVVGGDSGLLGGGPTAEWVHYGSVDLGWVGDGRITIRDGGRMEVSDNIYGGIRDGSSGRLEVLNGSDAIVHGAVLIGYGGEATIFGNPNGFATGTLLVGNSHLETRNLFVGSLHAFGTGEIVDGVVEVSESLRVASTASLGTSRLDVSSVSELLVGGNTDVGAGINNADIAGELVVDNSHFSTGSLQIGRSGPLGPFTGPGSGIVEFNSSDVEVSTRIDISFGARSSSLSVRSGSNLVVGGGIDVGYNEVDPGSGAKGEFLISGGAMVSAAWVGAGTYTDTSNGQIVVDSASLVATQNLAIGRAGVGSLMIESGATVQNGEDSFGISAIIGGSFTDDTAVGTGSVTVTGSGSRWIQTAGVNRVGVRGSGTMNVLSGGSVSGIDGEVATFAGSTGDVTINGNGSEWALNRDLVVGGQLGEAGGTGTVKVENEGRLSVDRILKLWETGVVDVADGGRAIVGSPSISPIDNTVLVGSGGILAGLGTIVGDVLNDGGVIAPGASPGVLHINGNLAQSAGGILDFEIAGLTPGAEYDQLDVTGNISLAGKLRLSLLNGFMFHVGDTFDFFNFGGSFDASSLMITGPVGVEFSSFSSDGSVTVRTVNSVPEGGPGLAILAATAFMLFRWRRIAQVA